MSDRSNKWRDVLREIEAEYTNYRGETRIRIFQPRMLMRMSTEYHTETQAIIYALDVERGVWRHFALDGFTDREEVLRAVVAALI